MPEDWSREEVAATVAEYLTMLLRELRHEPFNKREHNRALQAVLNGRSAGAIEFKLANVSAVLLDLEFPYIDGYKPRRNYQALLRDEVATQLVAAEQLALVAEAAVSALVSEQPAVRSLTDVFVDAPLRERRAIYDRREPPAAPRLGVNYLEREAQNSSLGRAGELFALEVEHRRLWEAGQRTLADRIEHASQTRGDGLGYDILSFEIDGRVRLIEVKTTSFGAMTPFFASRHEVAVSEAERAKFNLYRVFTFRENARIFALPGSLRESCTLDAIQYRAIPG